MDDERLKNPDKDIKADCFDELLERIRDLRSLENRVTKCPQWALDI